MSKEALILRGVSGSGKSWHAEMFRQMREENGQSVEVVSADDFWMKDGRYEFDEGRISEAHVDCFRRFGDACRRGVDSIIVDNTNMSAWEIAPYRMAALAHGYKIRVIRFVCSAHLARDRNQHDVPILAIMRQAANLEDLPVCWSQGEEVVPNNSGGNDR